ncbi:MAG: hypothetical protein M3281_06085 [Chloroflexota bacterium]|nr:hypothetical protein [Chloroflexota bacterium]
MPVSSLQVGGRQAGASTAGPTAQVICTLLTLVLGPIDLFLLGVRITTNQIILTITANSEGGLLGALLCALNNLLNPPATAATAEQLRRPRDASSQEIADRLNEILRLLR